jgi:hypothetical protein
MIEYQDAWRRYRRLRNTLLVIGLMELGPSETIYERVFGRILGFQQSWEYIGILISTWFLFQLDRKLRYFNCPRCGHSFFSQKERPPAFAWLRRRCAFCGLSKFALNPPDGVAVTQDYGIPENSGKPTFR